MDAATIQQYINSIEHENEALRARPQLDGFFAAFDLLTEQVNKLRNGPAPKLQLVPNAAIEQSAIHSRPTQLTPSKQFGGKDKLGAAIMEVGTNHLHKLPKEFTEADIHVLVRALYPEANANDVAAKTFAKGMEYRKLTVKADEGKRGHRNSATWRKR